ncbi:MAG: FtsX-like permease family protein [Planctomycetaceae bacterium]
MYKLLLSGRYLRTRFIALASIVSITLGVATMIVVNSVMAGFSTEMRDRIHGILADVMVDSINMDGEPHPEEVMQRIRSLVGEHVEVMTPTVEVYGLMTFEWGGEQFNRLVTIIGILPDQKNQISPLSGYMLSRKQKYRSESEPLDWTLTAQAQTDRARWQEYQRIEGQKLLLQMKESRQDSGHAEDPFAAAPAATSAVAAGSPADSETAVQARVYIGASLVSFPYRDQQGEVQTAAMVYPGQDIRLSTIKAGTPQTVGCPAMVADIFQSGMSEYDSNIVFCDLESLQAMRGTMDRTPGAPLDWRKGNFNSIQIKLKDYSLAPLVVEKLKRGLDGKFEVRTWEDKQGPLLAAVEVESAILNVLLFLIIAVAGFGILAIFYMIVVEKTRDIGILKALGANSNGIMSIFLGYGLSLGMVGAGAGVVLGLLFVRFINEIEDGLSWLTGRKVFDEAVYYFKEIPTSVEPGMVLMVAGGAMAIAVLASVLPARRAAKLHPVQALRYE